jgi:SAM-dependent methyltransferase
MTGGAHQSADYVFGSDQSELERLLVQAADLQPESTWLLDQIGVEEGWRTLDVGCGPIGVLDILSDRVGAAGEVVGVEREARFAAMARAEIAKRHLSNVSIVCGDVLNALLEEGSFDLVHERLVLVNLPPLHQQVLVGKMVSLARTGGIVAVESWDCASHVCHPENPSWQILNDAYRDAIRPTNGDGTSGRTLPWLLRSAGISDIQTKIHVAAVAVGTPRRMHRLSLLEITKPKILALGRLSEAEFEKHKTALADYLADPNTLLIDQLFVQSWGRKTT